MKNWAKGRWKKSGRNEFIDLIANKKNTAKPVFLNVLFGNILMQISFVSVLGFQ